MSLMLSTLSKTDFIIISNKKLPPAWWGLFASEGINKFFFSCPNLNYKTPDEIYFKNLPKGSRIQATCKKYVLTFGHTIVLPCYRVIGKNGKLVGYSGGLSRKELLLEHEKRVF